MLHASLLGFVMLNGRRAREVGRPVVAGDFGRWPATTTPPPIKVPVAFSYYVYGAARGDLRAFLGFRNSHFRFWDCRP